MKYYFAINEDGKTIIVPTQAEAKAINKDYAPVEIPTDKDSLLSWVQQMLDETLNARPEPSEVKLDGPREKVIEETLYELLGSGGDDGETIRDYASRIHSFYQAELDVREAYKEVPRAPAPVLEPIMDVQPIVEWILDTASQREIERIFEAMGARFGELVREVRN